jgi:ADP-L-glycero-D-manno-heptose 6-epimerase
MILITGGAGFIGSNLVATLAEREPNTPIAVCDWLEKGDKWRNLRKHAVDAFVLPEQLPSFLEGHQDQIKAVFHLGAISSTTETDGDRIVENNFQLSQMLWWWCASVGVRFIYASSAATYGDGEQGFADTFTAEALARLRPLNLYGWSKHAFDRFVLRALARGEAAPPQWAGLKFFNVYGPNEQHKGEMMSVVAKLVPQLRRGEVARLFKSYRDGIPDGGQQRDFVWVGDCVDVMLWLYQHPDAKSDLYNLGSGTARSFADLARATFAALNLPERIHYIEMPEAIRDKYQYFTEADLTKLRAAGYTHPMTPLEEGVRRYVQDYLVQDDPYR